MESFSLPVSPRVWALLERLAAELGTGRGDVLWKAVTLMSVAVAVTRAGGVLVARDPDGFENTLSLNLSDRV